MLSADFTFGDCFPAIKACPGLYAAVMTGAGVLIAGGLEPPAGWEGISRSQQDRVTGDRVAQDRLFTFDSGQQETPQLGLQHIRTQLPGEGCKLQS